MSRTSNNQSSALLHSKKRKFNKFLQNDFRIKDCYHWPDRDASGAFTIGLTAEELSTCSRLPMTGRILKVQARSEK